MKIEFICQWIFLILAANEKKIFVVLARKVFENHWQPMKYVVTY